MKIHKVKKHFDIGLTDTMCGIQVKTRYVSYYWKDVNCKNCLRKLNKKLERI